MEISLPGETFDPSWTRDGLTEKPEEKIGRRQWWLKQVIARVPPVSWSARWGIEPLACVNAAKGEFADIVRSAWIEAVARHPDPKWIAALLASAGDGELGPQAIGLLNLLPLAAQQAQAAAILDKPAIPIDTVWRLLSLTRFPLDRDGTRALCRRMERHVGASTAAYDPTLRQVLTEAAVRILPEVYEEISGRWVGPQWEPHRKALDEFFLHLRIRFDLQREF